MTPASPSDPPPRMVAVDRGRVCLADVGDGPPLLAIHGLPGSIRDYRWLAPCVEGPLRFIRPDMPGLGQTPRATEPRSSIPARVDFVLRLADALELDRFVVMGHSMGGAVALEVAARAPDRVRGLALLASVGMSVHRGFRNYRVIRAVATGLRVVPGLPRVLGPRIRRVMIGNGFSPRLRDDEAVHAIRCAAALDFARQRRAVSRVGVPTLIAWADDDRLVEPAIADALSDALPAGPRLHFPTGGHNIQKTQAVELGAALVDWIGAL